MDQIYNFLNKQAAPMNFDDLRKQQEEIAKQIKQNQSVLNNNRTGPSLDEMKARSQSVTEDILNRGKQQQPVNEPKPESAKPSPEPAKPAEPTKPKVTPVKETVKETTTVSKAKPKIGGKGLAGLGALGLAGAGAYALNKKKTNDGQMKAAEQLFNELVKVAETKKEEKEKKGNPTATGAIGGTLAGATAGSVWGGKVGGDAGARAAKMTPEFAEAFGMGKGHWEDVNRAAGKKGGRIGGAITGATLGLTGGAVAGKLMGKSKDKKEEKEASEIYGFLEKVAKLRDHLEPVTGKVEDNDWWKKSKKRHQKDGPDIKGFMLDGTKYVRTE